MCLKDGFLWCPHCGQPHSLKARFCPQTGQSVDRAIQHKSVGDHPLLGSVLDERYRVVGLIGRGGKGYVFGAEDLRTQGHVAVKVVTTPSASESVRRLQQEAELIASLRHPNVCALQNLGWIDGVGPYIVMERLFGETLSHMIRANGAMPLDLSLDLMLQLLSAVDAAHRMSIVHRDIKPSNIFITGHAGMPPIAKVLDFGYARRLGEQVSRLTQPGIVVGTPTYIAPETLSGAEGTHLGDLFACGAVLFEMLTGRHAFHGKNIVEVHMAIARGERRWLLDSRPEAPTRLASFIDRALSRDPSKRHSSAHEMHAELRYIAATLRPKLVLAQDDAEERSIVRLRASSSSSFEVGSFPPRWREEPSSSSGHRVR
jgi:serine/threonine-protein kinase